MSYEHVEAGDRVVIEIRDGSSYPRRSTATVHRVTYSRIHALGYEFRRADGLSTERVATVRIVAVEKKN